MKYLESFNPVTQSLIKKFSVTDIEQLDDIFIRAQNAHYQWQKTDLATRKSLIENYTELLKKNHTELATLISHETGKAFWDSETEVSAAISKYTHSLHAIEHRTPPAHYHPIGTMVVLGPFNFPFHLPNGHIIPALLAGNSVIFKPSEKTPACAEYMLNLWHQAGIPTNLLQVVYGYRDLGAALVEHPSVNGVLFTGGEQAGLAIHKALAGRPEVMLALELGGNNPLVIWNPNDIQKATEIAAYSAFISGGQRCTCARRLIIPENSADLIIEYLITTTKKLTVQEPFSTPQPFYSSLIDAQAVTDAYNWVKKLMDAGAELIYQGKTDLGKTFIAPIILDVTNCVLQYDQEIFAPILQIIRVKDFDQAITCANQTRFGLSAGLISEEETLWVQFKSEIKAGIINFNTPTVGASGSAAFGGIGRSGNFRPAGYFSSDYCSYPIACLEKTQLLSPLDRFLS